MERIMNTKLTCIFYILHIVINWRYNSSRSHEIYQVPIRGRIQMYYKQEEGMRQWYLIKYKNFKRKNKVMHQRSLQKKGNLFINGGGEGKIAPCFQLQYIIQLTLRNVAIHVICNLYMDSDEFGGQKSKYNPKK